MTLSEFMAARLDEKAATAHYAGAARVAWLTLLDADGQLAYTTVAAAGDDEPWVADGREITEAASVRIVWSPAQALREVEEMRRILWDHKPQTRGQRTSCGRCSYGNALGASWPCLTMDRFARIWSDHPDYDPAWARG